MWNSLVHVCLGAPVHSKLLEGTLVSVPYLIQYIVYNLEDSLPSPATV